MKKTLFTKKTKVAFRKYLPILYLVLFGVISFPLTLFSSFIGSFVLMFLTSVSSKIIPICGAITSEMDSLICGSGVALFCMPFSWTIIQLIGIILFIILFKKYGRKTISVYLIIYIVFTVFVLVNFIRANHRYYQYYEIFAPKEFVVES